MPKRQCNIAVISDAATSKQLKDMVLCYGDLIKLAIDIEQKILSGGGAWHRQCKAVLVERGSDPANIWGGSYYPDADTTGFLSQINIRPEAGNPSQEVLDVGIREQMEHIIRQRLT